jgi:hypothetical protein
MVPQRLTLVTLGARDLPTLRRFYGALGWQEVEGSNDTWCAYVTGGVVFSLYPEELLDAESSATQGRGGFTLAINVDHREEVDTTLDAAVAAGASPLGQSQDREWGGRSGYVADPEGNRWEIAWAPGLVLGERGEVVSFG